MTVLSAIGRFCYDFVIGDDWKIAAAVVTALGITLALLLSGLVGGGTLTVLGGLLLLVAFSASMVIDVSGRSG